MARAQRTQTTDEMSSNATNGLDRDIERLAARRYQALTSFRQTAEDLEAVNYGLHDKVAKLDELEVFVASQRSAATQLIEDNDAIRQSILEIIGG